MREITSEREIEAYKEELNNYRFSEQKQTKDYDYNPDGGIEYCDCGRPMNSHGWCYRCDG